MDYFAPFDDGVFRCEQIIAYTFKSKAICAEALNAAGDYRSVCAVDGTYHHIPKNDRLATYGDIAASLQLCGLWLELGVQNGGPRLADALAAVIDEAPDFWPTIQGEVLGHSNLAEVGGRCGLYHCINAKTSHVPITPTMIGKTVSAVLGAVDRDGGHEALCRVMDRLGLRQHNLLPKADVATKSK